jgi:hypothetical protein
VIPAKLQIATVTMVHVALRTFPETKAPMFRQNLSQIHGRSIMGATDVGCYFLLISISVLVGDKVSARSIVVDKAIGLRTAVGKYLSPLADGLQDNLTERHLNVVLVAKRGKVPCDLRIGHATSFKTAEVAFSHCRGAYHH